MLKEFSWLGSEGSPPSESHEKTAGPLGDRENLGLRPEEGASRCRLRSDAEHLHGCCPQLGNERVGAGGQFAGPLSISPTHSVLRQKVQTDWRSLEGRHELRVKWQAICRAATASDWRQCPGPVLSQQSGAASTSGVSKRTRNRGQDESVLP